ncbi:non-ribosomal peptide synthetase [Solwaraspora sp. WMMB335]|uniref:non-ribosomal peptide synthetase n=1 Tax=Solwaraspora sp. WMMB335 TaxID=3404118 RepID=UPI003B93FF60
MTGLTQRLAELPARRRARFLATLRAEASRRGPARRGNTGPAPLTYAQEALWQLPGAPQVSRRVRLRGALDESAMRSALTTVVARHEALRTTIEQREGAATQVVTAGLSRLWRVELTRDAPGDHLLLVAAHPVVADRRSLCLVLDEVAEVYRALRDGEQPHLPALPVQFPDYAVWERDNIPAPETGAEVLEFPTDRPRGGAPGHADVHRFPIGREQLRRARELAAGESATLFDVLVAAFFTFLHRYTGLDDLTIGTPGTDRRDDAVARVIGPVTTTLALRGDLRGDPTFRELTRRLRDATPDRRAVDVGEPVRDLVFSLEQAEPAPALPGLLVSEETVEPGTARTEMSWTLTDATLTIEFDTGLFDADSVARFARHYDEILRTLTARPDAPLSAADMLSPADDAFLAQAATGPVRPIRETTVVAEFEARVAQGPENVAVLVDGVATSYAELNARANRLAALLRGRGAGPGTTVGLCLRRTVDLPTAKLAVLKTGAAYVPLDPAHPPARVAEIAADAQLRAVVAHTAVAAAVGTVAAPVLVLDDAGAELAAAPAGDPPLAARPGDVAYIIYTSGSTGRPKGVLLEHRGVVNFIDSTRELFDLTPADRVLGFASSTFDVSVFETFSALLTGACLCLATEDERLSIDRLQALMQRAGITVIDLPPTVMPLLVPERFTDLRIAFVGGEAFSGELVNRWNPGRRLFNGYGPTECTVTMIVEECPGNWDSSPPIGLPMANHVAHVLDRHLRPVPVGVPGELVIGGAGLARGYLDRAQLTAEKFVTDPFGTAPGGRLYRTGDLAKRLPDGRLVFLGRLDQQVKIRGLRIELGEVESALASVPGIGAVTVRPWTDDAGDKHLVGYLSGLSARQIPAVRDHLGAVLPAYMIPSFFVVLPELPLTSSGKVDWRRLPSPDRDHADADAGTNDPTTTETERVLLRDVLAPLLRTTRLGVRDDFFQAGGNSLQAAQLMSAINRRFGVEITLNDFFVSPTVAHLAALVDTRASATRPDDRARVLMRAPEPARVVLIHPSGGELFCYVPLVRALREGIGAVGFAADPRDTAAPPQDALPIAAARIAKALAGEPEPFCLAGWSYGGVLAFEAARQLERDTGRRPPVVLIDAGYDEDTVPLDERTVRRRFIHDVARLAGQDGPAVRAVLDDPDLDTEDLRKILAVLGVELDLSDDELATRHAVFRSCALSMQAYRPPGSYGGPVTLLAVAPRTTFEEQWRVVCAGRFHAEDLPGDHYTLFAGPALNRITAAVERAVDL